MEIELVQARTAGACGTGLDEGLRHVACTYKVLERSSTMLYYSGQFMIKHFSHEHPLVFRDEKKNDGDECCSACTQPISSSPPSYGCNQCKEFVLHRSCADLPKKIYHSFHPRLPRHHLTLLHKIPYDGGKYFCDACGKVWSAGFVYHCTSCDFDLDVGCAWLMPTISSEFRPVRVCFPSFSLSNLVPGMSLVNGDAGTLQNMEVIGGCWRGVGQGPMMEVQSPQHVACTYKVLERSSMLYYPGQFMIKHFSHEHPLVLRDEKKDDGDECCSTCTQPISSSPPSYGCNRCKEFVLHRSCAELPEKIYHPFHPHLPRHHLTLLHKIPYDGGKYFCNACRKVWSAGFIYHCTSCNFDLDVGCASLVPTISYEGHDHLITLFDKIYYDQGLCMCKSCAAPCLGPVLHCVDCDFNVHKSCADKSSYTELPKQIQHPFHPLHPLTLSNHPQQQLKCNACGIWIRNFSFCCEECNFALCVECTSLVPTIKYDGHQHLLTLFNKIYDSFSCDSCHGICEEFLFFFRCVGCNFNLHIQCFPSFRTLEHKCHIHPLTLANSIAHEDDDSDEFYCDACENERYPRYPVYYCAECSFVVEIGCVISEVLSSLIAKQNSNTTAKEAAVELVSNAEAPTEKLEELAIE